MKKFAEYLEDQKAINEMALKPSEVGSNNTSRPSKEQINKIIDRLEIGIDDYLKNQKPGKQMISFKIKYNESTPWIAFGAKRVVHASDSQTIAKELEKRYNAQGWEARDFKIKGEEQQDKFYIIAKGSLVHNK